MRTHNGTFFEAVKIPEYERRSKVPVLYVSGSHYDIGYDIGRTFSSMIKSFISKCDRLHKFEAEYNTVSGREAYEKTLVNMKERYPYYLKEIQGTADGAGVSFQQLFLLHLDDIIETINDTKLLRNDIGGCSSVGINNANTAVLGHTEDAFSETLNHFYILAAHIIPTEEDRNKGAVEERFASLCYAGQLPGYTMGFTEHGLVFSINTLSPRDLKPGNTPRTFLTRAMLTAKSREHIEKILLDAGLGTANGFSVNMIWTDANGEKRLYNFEVAPDLKNDESKINIRKFSEREALIHCNRYERIKVPEVIGPIIDSSAARLEALNSYNTPEKRRNIETMLSDQSEKKYIVFQDRDEANIKTIAAGIFDLNEGTWNIFITQPNCSEPVAILPIRFSMLH